MEVKCGVQNVAEILQDLHNKNRDRVRLVEFCSKVLCGKEIIYTGGRADGCIVEMSDTDIMHISHDVIAVLDDMSTSYKNERAVLQIDTVGVYPGHVKLQYRGEPTKSIDILKSGEKLKNLCVEGSDFISTRKVVNNCRTIASDVFGNFGYLKETQVHGPSAQMNLMHSNYCYEFDFVYAVPCLEWPKEAHEWFERERKFGFPDTTLIKHIHSLGTCVVPFGRSKDDGQNSESDWRISFTQAEREIMWSLESSQIQCYYILKAVCKLVKERFPDCIQSYFFKTSFLWNLEQIPKPLWGSNDICSRVADCIQWLMKNLREETVPNYFIPANNMFRRDTCNHDTLQMLLDCLKKYTLPDSLKKLEDILMIINEIRRCEANSLIKRHGDYLEGVSLARQIPILFLKDPSPQNSLKTIQEQLLLLQDLELCNEISIFLPFLEASNQSIAGSLMFCASEANIDTKIAREMLEKGCSSDKYSGLLKKATVLYAMRNVDEAEDVLDKLICKHDDPVLYMTPFNYDCHLIDDLDVYSKADLSFEECLHKFVAYDVIFLPSEISVAPDGVKYLLSDGHAVFIPPVLYAFYLRFIIFHKKGHIDKCKELIGRFFSMIKDCKVGAIHVKFSLLGQCSFLSGNYQKAAEYFLLAIKNGNNGMSIVWQLAIVLFHVRELFRKFAENSCHFYIV